MNQTNRKESSDVLPKKEAKPMTESLKSRAAIFEQNSQRITPPTTLSINKTSGRFPQSTAVKGESQTIKQTELYAKNYSTQETANNSHKEKMEEKKESVDDLKDLDFIRNKRGDSMREEKRRHTYETREREIEADRFRRISLESKSPK